MSIKRSLRVAAICLALFAILIASASAAGGPQKAHRQFHFKTPAAVLKYLKAHGVSTRGMVIQRGARNYAGPNCPGKRWHCTKAKHVIQFATSSNQFVCSASYGTPSGFAPPPISAPPNECVIVQVSAGNNNNARCIESTSDPGAALDCQIWQENTTGANNASIVQLITQRANQSQSGTESAQVHQQNGSGPNNSTVAQTIWQNAFTSGPVVGQDQSANVDNTINQNGATSTQLSTMSQLVIQVASAGGKRDEDNGSQSESAPIAPTAPTPFSGNQNQDGNGTGHVDQFSDGVSRAFNFQNMFQKETAPSGVLQNQNGPFFCCTFQGNSPNNVFTIQQSKTQLTSAPDDPQSLNQEGELDTTGQGHIRQFANENGTTQSNSCDVMNGACEASQSCASGGEVGSPTCSTPQTCSTDNACCPSFLEGCGIGFAPASLSSSGKVAVRTRTRTRQERFRHHF